MDKKSCKIICTAFSNGKRHDFRLFKESKTRIHPDINALTDSAYLGLQKLHAKTQMPKKKPLIRPRPNSRVTSRHLVNKENPERIFAEISDNPDKTGGLCVLHNFS